MQSKALKICLGCGNNLGLNQLGSFCSSKCSQDWRRKVEERKVN